MSHFKSRLSLIVRVNVVLNRTFTRTIKLNLLLKYLSCSVVTAPDRYRKVFKGRTQSKTKHGPTYHVRKKTNISPVIIINRLNPIIEM